MEKSLIFVCAQLRHLQKKCCCVAADQKTCLAAKFVGICKCAVAFCLQVPKLCTDLDPTLLYILILGRYGKKKKIARKNKIHRCTPIRAGFFCVCSAKKKFTYILFIFFLTMVFGSRYWAAVLFMQVPQQYQDLDLSLIYILKMGTHSKFD